MTEQAQDRTPTQISLHSKSHLLMVEFTDGRRFELPCEYLRVFSRAKEVRTLDKPVTGKEEVNISSIEPQGQYAVRLVFDDGHDTGIYSWDTLYELGERQAENWADYLRRLEQIGYTRDRPVDNAVGPRRISLLYFTYLVKQLRKESEEVEIPTSVQDVAGLIGWLRKRYPDRAHLFREGSIRITVNKQFAEPFTRVEHSDEVAFVPTSPVAPVADSD